MELEPFSLSLVSTIKLKIYVLLEGVFGRYQRRFKRPVANLKHIRCGIFSKHDEQFANIFIKFETTDAKVGNPTMLSKFLCKYKD